MDKSNIMEIWEKLKDTFSGSEKSAIEIVVRGVVVILVGFYFLFSFMIVRQVNLLTRFLGTSLSPWIKIFAWLYVLYCLSILLMALDLF